MSDTASSPPGLSQVQLKILAMASMLTDHIGAAFFPSEIWIRCLGRLAFPIYAFLIAVGFFHTRSRARYLGRLLLFALLSQAPYTILLYAYKLPTLWAQPMLFVTDTKNSLFVLSAGLLAIWGIEKLRRFGIGGHLAGLLLAGGWTVLSVLIHTEYCYFGVPLIVASYEAMLFQKSSRCKSRLSGAAVQFALCFAALVLYVLLSLWLQKTDVSLTLLYGAAKGAALLLLCLYTGKPGRQSAALRLCFYWFYPVHMAVPAAVLVLSGGNPFA